MQIVAWILVSVVYRYEKSLHGNDNDLWGWSCSTKAKAILETFNGVVDFFASVFGPGILFVPFAWDNGSLMMTQGSSWKVSHLEFPVKMVFALGHYIIYRKEELLEKQDINIAEFI